MSGGEIAALIAAGAFVMLVLVLAVWILRLGRTVDAATTAIKEITERTNLLLDNVNTTVENVNTALTQAHTTLDGVNLQLERLDTITGHAAHVTATVANLATVIVAAVANPLVKVAAFGYGVRRAVLKRRHDDEEREVRETIKSHRRAAKRGAK